MATKKKKATVASRKAAVKKAASTRAKSEKRIRDTADKKQAALNKRFASHEKAKRERAYKVAAKGGPSKAERLRHESMDMDAQVVREKEIQKYHAKKGKKITAWQARSIANSRDVKSFEERMAFRDRQAKRAAKKKKKK